MKRQDSDVVLEQVAIHSNTGNFRDERGGEFVMQNTMTPEHPRWREFCERLGRSTSKCSGKEDRPFATAILEDMGLDVAASLAFF